MNDTIKETNILLIKRLHTDTHYQFFIAFFLWVSLVILALPFRPLSQGVTLSTLFLGGLIFSSFPRYFNRLLFSNGMAFAYGLFALPLIFTLRYHSVLNIFILSMQFVSYLTAVVLAFTLLQRGLNQITDWMVALVMAIALEGLIDYFTGFSLFLLGESRSGMGGLWAERTRLGLFLALFSSLVLSLSYRNFLRGGLRRIIAIAMMVTMISAIVLSGSLTGWIIFAVSSLIGSIWLMRRQFLSWHWLTVSAALMLIFIGLMIGVESFRSLLIDLLEHLGAMAQYREMHLLLPFWIDLSTDFSAYGWFGADVINHSELFERIEYLRSLPYGLLVLIQSGIVGFIFLIALEIFLLVKLYTRRIGNEWMLVAFMMLFPFKLAMDISFLDELMFSLMMMIVLGIAFSMATLNRDKLSY